MTDIVITMIFFHSVYLLFFCAISILADYDSLLEMVRLKGGNHRVNLSVTPNVIVNSKQFILDLNKHFLYGTEDVFVQHVDLNLNSQGLSYDIENNLMTVSDKVTIDKKDMRLTCDKATYFMPDVIDSEGEVHFMYKDYDALSEAAHYELQNQLITLLGDVVLKQKDDFIGGDMVKFDIRNETIVSQGRSKIKISTERLHK